MATPRLLQSLISSASFLHGILVVAVVKTRQRPSTAPWKGSDAHGEDSAEGDVRISEFGARVSDPRDSIGLGPSWMRAEQRNSSRSETPWDRKRNSFILFKYNT
jgi:hypothetical protein